MPMRWRWPPREPHAALADLGGVALGQLVHDEVVQLGDPRRALDRRLVDVAPAARPKAMLALTVSSVRKICCGT